MRPTLILNEQQAKTLQQASTLLPERLRPNFEKSVLNRVSATSRHADRDFNVAVGFVLSAYGVATHFNRKSDRWWAR